MRGGGRRFYSSEEYNQHLYRLLCAQQPFLVGRFGTVELGCVRAFDFRMKKVYEGNLFCMSRNAGFFPKEENYAFEFVNLIKTTLKLVDIMGFWSENLEDYYISKYTNKDCALVDINDLSPFKDLENSWLYGLAGKKVLVISPFAETIQSQHKVYDQIFQGISNTPEFTLRTLKSVQTIAGNKDERFSTWFDALEWMYREAIRIDFDVAIIGCGAYGFPLGAKLKQAGKQAIVLGGMTQALFGIRCKRFDEAPDYDFLRRYYTDRWVYPSVSETPSGSTDVEGGAYWK